MRLSSLVIGLCIIVTAGAIGGLSFLLTGIRLGEAGAITLSALAVLTAANLFLGRAGRRSGLDGRLTNLSRGTGELARQVGELGRRVVTTEAAVAGLTERPQTHEPFAGEIETLGSLVKQLAESVAAHEAALLHSQSHAAQPPVSIQPAPMIPVTAPSAVASPAPTPLSNNAPGLEQSSEATPPVPPIVTGRFAGMEHAAAFAIIRDALENNRADLYLQPILTLPQRKVRYYEAVTRLRTESGDLLMPADFLSTAESGGLMPMLDNLMVYRGIQIVRRLTAKSREIGLFCNISGATLLDPQFFPQIAEFLEANHAVASALVLEFSQATLRALGPIEYGSLAQLATLGFRFSLDHVTDLRLEPRALAEQGFRFVKVAAPLLLERSAVPAGDIDIADLPNLLSRYGIELIAERIETETTVVDLLDLHVRFGQGFLFSPPRPVRAEVFGAAPPPPVTVPASERIEPQLARPPRRRETEYPQAPAAPMRTPTGVVQIARDMVRRA